MAAALFDIAAPDWCRAVSAGLEPQDQVSEHAAPLLRDDPAGSPLDLSAQVPLTEVAADLIVAIDCDIPSARRWTLTGAWPDPAVGEELRRVTTAPAGELSPAPPPARGRPDEFRTATTGISCRSARPSRPGS